MRVPLKSLADHPSQASRCSMGWMRKALCRTFVVSHFGHRQGGPVEVRELTAGKDVDKALEVDLASRRLSFLVEVARCESFLLVDGRSQR